MRLTRPALALTAALLLTGCQWEGTGTIIHKEYEEGEWETYSSCSYNSSTKTNTCKPAQRYDDEDFQLLVRDVEDGKEHWIDVHPDDFEAYQVGDTYTNGGN